MNANDILIDLLEDNRRRTHRVFKDMPDACIYWKPDYETNNIAVTVWHMGRMFDVFLIQQAQGKPAGEECWFQHGWVSETGYDPRGIGESGWGMMTGYSYDEAAGVPYLKREQLLKYLDEVYDMVKEYLKNKSIEELLTPAAGFDGKYTKYQCIQMPLLDNVRHLGEIYALKSRWQRENQAENSS